MTTKDSIVGIRVEWVFPQDTATDEFVIAHYKLYRHDPSLPITKLAVGVLIEADIVPAQRLGGIQKGVDNQPGLDGPRNLAWQQGTDTAGHWATGNNTATRFRAGVAAVGLFLGSRVGNSLDDIQPGGGPSDQFLYNSLTTLAGIDIFTDSVTDLYTLVALDKEKSIAVNETLAYTLVYASDTLSEGSFLATIDAGILAAKGNLCNPCYCPCANDPGACDGMIVDVVDVVTTVGVAFRGQSTVVDTGCPAERTNFNSCADSVTDVVDVVKCVDVAFRNASPSTYDDPCNCP